MELTQKVMVNYTASILRHSLGLQTLGVPIRGDELPVGWVLEERPTWRYAALDGPNGEHLEFYSMSERYCVSLAWLYDVSPSELLHAYMLPTAASASSVAWASVYSMRSSAITARLC